MPEGGTPETTAYLVLGLAVVAIVLLLLIGSMIARWRNLKRDAAMLDQLEEEDSAKAR